MGDIDTTTAGAVATAIAALSGALAWIMRNMWKGRAAETERLRDRDDAQWEALEEENARLRKRVADLEGEQDARLVRLETDASAVLAELIGQRRRNGGDRVPPSEKELAVSNHLGNIVKAQVESPPDPE